MGSKLDLVGLEFNGCLVIRESENINGRLAYLCRCYCGKEFNATTKVIRSGAKRSCGCAKKLNAKKHGMSGSKMYSSWSGMIQRCTNKKNPKYNRYGGRGISVCKRWLFSFEHFKADMGEPLIKKFSIGRIDNDGMYEKENCRWESDIQQANNTSRTVLFKFLGKERTARDIAGEYGISYDLVYYRLVNGCKDVDVIKKENSRHRFVLVNGESLNVTAAISLLKIPVSSFYSKVRRGASPQSVIDSYITKD